MLRVQLFTEAADHTEAGATGGYEFPGVDVWYLTQVLYRAAYASNNLPSTSIHYKYYIYAYIYVTKCVEVDEVQYAISCPSVKLPYVHPKWTWNGMH